MKMRLVAARDGPHFSHARMHLSGLLDLAFSDSVRPHFYFAWGCFRNFWVRSAMYRARDTRLSMLGAAAKRFNFKPSCSRGHKGYPFRANHAVRARDLRSAEPWCQAHWCQAIASNRAEEAQVGCCWRAREAWYCSALMRSA